ncbi:hypothetical protein D3C86_1697640 [compost metagenome]
MTGFVVVFETLVERALTRNETLELIRPGTHRIADRVVIGGDDPTKTDQGFIQRIEALALLEANFNGALVQFAQRIAVDRPHQASKRRRQFRVGQAQDREQHIVGTNALAVVKFQPWLDANGPGAGICVGLGKFGQGQTRADIGVPFPELAVQRPAANDPAAHRFVRVKVA